MMHSFVLAPLIVRDKLFQMSQCLKSKNVKVLDAFIPPLLTCDALLIVRDKLFQDVPRLRSIHEQAVIDI